MAEVAPPEAPTAPVKVSKEKAPKPRKPGPSTADLVLRAVSACTDRKGMSFVALKKELATQGYDVEHNTRHIKRVIKTMVSKGTLLQTKGTGASGSYKVNKTAVKPKNVAKKAADKASKPAAKKPAAAKKPKSETPKRTPANKGKKSPEKKGTKIVAAPKKGSKKDINKTKKPAAKKSAKK